MKVFTATNGILFTITEDGVLRWEGGYDPRRVTDALREYFQRERDIALTTANFETLREYFQAERDEALGRWRDPENPNMVCYPVACDLDAVWVMYEGAGSRYYVTRTGWELTRPQYASETAGRYFEAHPEPKPWEKARPYCDEIWALTIHGCEQPVYVTEFRGEPVFQVPGGETMSLSHGAITAGRRIWPEPRIGGAE